MDFSWVFNLYDWLQGKGVLVIPIVATLFLVHFLKITFVLYSGKHKSLYVILTNVIISFLGSLGYILFIKLFTITFYLWASFLTVCLSCGLVDIFDSAIKWVQDKFFKKASS